VEHTGYLEDGTVFNSNVGKPLSFKLGVGKVIKCWDLAFPKLAKGSRAILTCPPEYAYGERGK
jgi:FKBP-type peptidyl-prolyl cis-trans isomerase